MTIQLIRNTEEAAFSAQKARLISAFTAHALISATKVKISDSEREMPAVVAAMALKSAVAKAIAAGIDPETLVYQIFDFAHDATIVSLLEIPSNAELLISSLYHRLIDDLVEAAGYAPGA